MFFCTFWTKNLSTDGWAITESQISIFSPNFSWVTVVVVVIYTSFCSQDMQRKKQQKKTEDCENESPQRCSKSAESKFELCCFVLACVSQSILLLIPIDFHSLKRSSVYIKFVAQTLQLIPRFISPSEIKYPFVFSFQSLITVNTLHNEAVAVIVTWFLGCFPFGDACDWASLVIVQRLRPMKLTKDASLVQPRLHLLSPFPGLICAFWYLQFFSSSTHLCPFLVAFSLLPDSQVSPSTHVNLLR